MKSKKTNEKEVNQREWQVEDFYYEPWDPSMDKKLTKEQQKELDAKIDECIACILVGKVEDDDEDEDDE